MSEELDQLRDVKISTVALEEKCRTHGRLVSKYKKVNDQLVPESEQSHRRTALNDLQLGLKYHNRVWNARRNVSAGLLRSTVLHLVLYSGWQNVPTTAQNYSLTTRLASPQEA
ncbi:hypothetical protein CSUI_002236, partial [Cystoisospora suis]